MAVLDSIIELQEYVTIGSGYSRRYEWAKVDDVWAAVDQTGTSEDFENDAARKLPLRFTTFRIRWRSDVRKIGESFLMAWRGT